MKVEFLRPWGHYSKGQVIDPPDGQASEMIRRGIAAKVETVVKESKRHGKVKAN